MKIQIETIPHAEQRYETVGDWFRDKDGTLHIKVSDMGNDKYALLVAIHELIEVSLCEHRGITQGQVDAFDMEFEANRKDGDESEAGDDPAAPYGKEHRFATGIESLMASELDVNWKEYEDANYAL